MLTTLFEQLLSMALTALPVMAVVLAARWLLRSVPKKYVYLLWLVVAFRLVCPVAPESPVGLVRAEDTARQVAAAADTYIEPTLTYRDNGGFTPDYDVLLNRGYTPNEQGEIVTNSAGTREALQVKDVLSLVWLAGVAAMLAYLVFTTLRLRRQVATAILWEDNIWECDGIPTPFVLGLFRPHIYIPFRMTEAERAYILAHERYHIRHEDHWAKLLGLLILSVYWWNPAVWLCWVLFCRDMEMRCDEAVLEQLGDGVKRDYSLSLVSFALDRRAPMALAFGEHDAAKRVKNVLRWKRAKPAVIFLAAVAVILVAMVCGTNAGQRDSRVILGYDETGAVEFEVKATEDIHSWALYMDVYDGGRLISSSPCVLDGFAEENTGVSTRDFTGRLWADLEYDADDRFSDRLTWNFTSFGTAEFYETLPRDHYTGMVKKLGDGSDASQRYKLGPEGGEVLLCSLLLSTRPNGAVTVDAADTPQTRLNATVVQYRLVLSNGPMEDLPIPQLDLAQELFDLRTGSRRDEQSIRALVAALNGDRLGTYSVVTEGQTVELAFEEPLDEQQEKTMWDISQLLLALVADADQINYSFPTVDGSKRMTYYCEQDQPDAWAKTMGYADIKEMGASAQGVRDLLTWLGMATGDADSAAQRLFDAAQTQDPISFTLQLMKEPLWGGSTGACTVHWPGNFGPLVSFHDVPADPAALDAAVARRAVVLMRLYPEEVGYVLWSYPDANGEMVRRELHSDEMAMLLALSSDSYTSLTVDSAEILEHLLRFLGGITDKAASMQVEEGNSFSPTRLAQQTAVWFTPEDIYDIEYAELVWWDGQRFTPLTGEGYDYLEERLSTAKEVTPTACPYHSVLYLHRTDGVVGKVQVAEDSCDIFRAGERYFQFGKRNQPPWSDDNSALYGHFGTNSAELPHYTVDAAREGEVFANVWLTKEETGGLLDGYLPWDVYFDQDTWQYEDTDPLQCYVYYYGLTRAQFRRFVEGLETVPERLQDVELEGNEADTANVTVIGYWSRAEIERMQATIRNTAGETTTYDIMGYPAYMVITAESLGDWTQRTYYTVQDGEPVAIAESFGYGEPEDTIIDLDGDGVTELIANVTFGGDGARRVYVYQRRGNDVYLGQLEPETLPTELLPNFLSGGAVSWQSEYDPAEQVFRIHYTQKDTEEPGVWEIRDLSRFEFYKYTP